MVESDVSGVMFTANPRAERTDEIVINASWGLGEAIVSGLLIADVPGVTAAWRAQGFFLAERIDLDGWATLRLGRPLSMGRRETSDRLWNRSKREQNRRAAPPPPPGSAWRSRRTSTAQSASNG